jgi:hypothetical protein
MSCKLIQHSTTINQTRPSQASVHSEVIIIEMWIGMDESSLSELVGLAILDGADSLIFSKSIAATSCHLMISCPPNSMSVASIELS